MAEPIAVIVKGYPRLSETFIAQEVLALERLGLQITIVSLRAPTDGKVHELNRAITAPVLYLPEYLHEAPGRTLRAGVAQLLNPRLLRAGLAWLRDLARDPSRNRLRRFGQALVLAHELPGRVRWLHVHYLHTPASVGRYAALLRGLPFSLSAHAKDVWTIPDWEKREKLMAARWSITCSQLNLDHLRALAPAAVVELGYHGLDLARFPVLARGTGVNGSDPARPVQILTVARAVEKKGLDLLLHALSRLPAGLHWRFRHLGGGDLLGELRVLAERLGVADRVAWEGAATQAEVLAALRAADLFCLPARVAQDGDRDGVPNVLMEAMAQELPVVATRAAAIPELVLDGATGVLVPAEEDPAALSAAILALARDPARRRSLGRAGRRRIEESFTPGPTIGRLAGHFSLAMPEAA